MGDRGNIVIKQSDGQVWLYTHWQGSDIKAIAQRALSKQWRWTDESYLARIVFDELSKGAASAETGYGISTRITDNEHDIVVLDVPKQEIHIVTEASLEKGRVPDVLPYVVGRYWSFKAFVQFNVEAIPT